MNVLRICSWIVAVAISGGANAQALQWDEDSRVPEASDVFADIDSAPSVGRTDAPAPAVPVEPLFSKRYVKLLWADGVDIATSPLRFDHDDWHEIGYIGAGLAVTVALIDKPVRDAVQRNRKPGVDRFLKDIEPFGQKQYTLPTLGAFYVYGLAVDDPNARATAQDGVAVSFIANAATSVFKGVFGRARPFQGHGAHHWRPFEGDTAFPSGHATQAFAIASVIAHHYEETWVEATAYGMAGLVGFARIDHDKHWTSDVIAGALVGSFIGREIVRFNGADRAEHSAFVPSVGGDAGQVTLTWAY